jgi:hypothetical protein
MKQASVRLATARAQRVFPVPGGPNKRTPLGGSIPRFTNLSGYNLNNNLIYFLNIFPTEKKYLHEVKESRQLHGASQFALYNHQHQRKSHRAFLQPASWSHLGRF